MRTLLPALAPSCGYAAACALLGISARNLGRLAWNAPQSSFGRLMVDLAFRSVYTVLRLFYPVVIADPQTHLIGTPRFPVTVAGTCSGIESLALLLVLTLGWLLFARRELRLARAIWLVPIALALAWALNVVRIATLIAIGNAGYPDVAVNGFHSEAGWIAFLTVGLAFLSVANRLQALHRRPLTTRRDAGWSTPALYLLPFLALVATSMLTHAAAGGFDWLYPVRPLVAVCVLFILRRGYAAGPGRVDWRFGWIGLSAGAFVGALWVWAEHGGNGAMLAGGLALLSPGKRVFWLAARVLSAVILVPVAEELAFRGFLARRLQSEHVDRVHFRTLGWVAIAVSSLAFGAMHGRMWLAGTLAGVVFALCARFRDRLGEAIAAHAVANLLLALWVLSRGDYSLW